MLFSRSSFILSFSSISKQKHNTSIHGGRSTALKLLFFHQKIVQDRDLLNQVGMASAYNSQQNRLIEFPCAAGNQSIPQPALEKTSVNTDSELTTYNVSVPKKRARNSVEEFYAVPNFLPPQKNIGVSFAGEEILPQIQQSQLEIDAIIYQHNKKIRYGLEERQKQQARLLAGAIGEGVMKKLKEKDERIQRIGKLTFVLQERVKSLYVENQLWRDLAHTNEATATSLRTNLEQVLLQVGSIEYRFSAGARGQPAVEDDAKSGCGSTDHVGEGKPDENEEGLHVSVDRRCHMCRERESCVLLLPCRHLCLCTVCGSGSHHVRACPVCHSSMNAILHVNTSC